MNRYRFMQRMATGCFLAVLISCSTTRNLPEGEMLYTGIKKIEVTDKDDSKAYKLAMEEIEAALDYPPNNALFGSSSMRTPFPVGLWIYNGFVNKESKIGKWFFKTFAAKPVFISTVNPDVRTSIAHNLLRENGYFDGTSSYQLIPNKKNPRKSQVSYQLTMNHVYTFDSIRYIRTRSLADSLSVHADEELLRRGDPFRVASLEAERQRISSMLRGRGFYYHRPEFIVYQADTLMAPGKVWLHVMRKPGLPQSALSPFRIGNVSVSLKGYKGEEPNDSASYKGLTVYYENKLRVHPSALYKRVMFKTGELYSESNEQLTQTALSRLEIFRFAEMQFTPRDTARNNNILDLQINTLYDLPLNGELELNVTDKSNNLRGPGAIFSLSRNNIFGGGEVLKIEAKASYEWQTDKNLKGLNSYELGAGATLTFPSAVFPGFADRGLTYSTYTNINLNVDALNRSRFFRMVSFSGSLSYDFQPNAVHRHSFTPFRLTYNRMLSRTLEFDSIAALNPALLLSLSDQFIPALSYTYTYDDSPRDKNNHIWWQASITEAGNLLASGYAVAGNKWNHRGKKLLGNPFAQFIKATGEFRYNYRIDDNNRLVMRIMGGAIYSYGNARISPFSEQFYIGGANSVRAFTIRSIGPGRFVPADPKTNRYAYIDQTGDLKLEANLEYRFRILGNLYGATFLDCGGVWLIRNDANRPGGTFNLSKLGNDLALGAGAGLRYDLDFLVVRLDLGVGLHLPYETSKHSYYNIPKFNDALGLHLAVGYPF